MAVDRKAFLRTLGDAPRSVKFGILVVASYTLVAIFAPLIAPFTQSEVVSGPYEAASGTHLLGTDALGRDFFTRVVFGIRNTVGIALVTTIVTFVFGAFFGLLAAVRGGWVDQLLSRIVDVLMSIPALIFKLLLLSIAGTAVINLILIVAFVDSTRVFRLSRAAASDVAVMEFIEAARLRGETLLSLMLRETLPNIVAPLAAGIRGALQFCVPGDFVTVIPWHRHSAACGRLGVDGARKRCADQLWTDHPADPSLLHWTADHRSELYCRLAAAYDQWN